MNEYIAFAAYRMPDESEPNMIIQTEGIPVTDNRQNLMVSKGFMMSPFVADKNKPTVLIKADKVLYGDKDVFAALEKINIHLNDCNICSNDNYKDAYELFNRVLQKDMFQKLVLSTSSVCEQTTSPIRMFLKACKKYPRMMIYLCYTPQTGMWLGCTPEIIVDGKDNNWHTMALAGTQPLNQGRMPKHWDEKNIKEQKLVAGYIYNTLINNAYHVEASMAYTQRAGQLAHLRTDFNFILQANKIKDIVEILHPTPAVCGLPKEEAYRFINTIEGYDRRYYAGIVGPVSKDEAHLYINLRCAEVFADKLLLYAGGGIIKESNKDDERREVEEKMKMIKDLI
jgi:isochorismate synthase